MMERSALLLPTQALHMPFRVHLVLLPFLTPLNLLTLRSLPPHHPHPFLLPTDNTVPLHPHRVDPIQHPAQTQFGQRRDPGRLQEFADDPIRLGEVALDEQDRAGLVGERVGERGAGDAGADDDDLGGQVGELYM